MKTAISMPDDIFQAAEYYAKLKHKSRSEVYSEAVAEYLARHSVDRVTDAMNTTMKKIRQLPDSFVESTARRAFDRTEW